MMDRTSPWRNEFARIPTQLRSVIPYRRDGLEGEPGSGLGGMGCARSAGPAPTRVRDTVSVHLARLVLNAGVQAGVSPHEISSIAEFGTAAFDDDLTRIPTVAQRRLWELVYAAGGPGVGLRVAALGELGRLHVWDYLVTGGQTLAEGFTDAAEFLAIVADPALVLNVAEDGSRLTVGYQGTPFSEAVDHEVTEFAMALLLRRAREAKGAGVIPVRVGFAHRAPKRHTHLIDEFGTSNIQFDQDASTLTFLDPERSAPPEPRDPELGRIMRQYARSVIDSARPVCSWIDSFRGVLLAVLATGTPTGQVFDEVAQRLSVSARTIQRRLAEHETSWRAEIETMRHKQAIRLLRETELPVGAIAGHLGYNDHRALGRAFRRWTGQTPDAFRRSVLLR